MRNLAKRIEKQVRRSRIILLTVLLPLATFELAGAASSALRMLWVLLGFSLIIFLHELGHFLVARACSVKCLAFSLGIGPRMFGWRKGSGLSFGGDPFDPDRHEKPSKKALQESEGAVTASDLPQSADAPPHSSQIGDCDYRVSWLPLGGYVRMLGQDDMDPTKISNDPRAFNKRPIWQRMCIVSAGVIMNLIFAAVTFSIIFSPGVGVDFPPAEVGSVVYGSPAEKAGLQIGDKIVSVNGTKPRGFLEFTDVVIASALSSGTDKIDFIWERKQPDGTIKTFEQGIQPVAPPDGGSGFLSVGVSPMPGITVVSSKDTLSSAIEERGKSRADGGAGETENAAALAKLMPKDKITSVNGVPVKDYVGLYQEVQKSNGDPITLTVTAAKGGNERTITLKPDLEPRLGVEEYPALFGIGPLLKVIHVVPHSAAATAGIMDDDIILRAGDRSTPTSKQFREIGSSSAGKSVELEVRRGTETKTIAVTPREENHRGIFGLEIAEDRDDTTVAVRDASGPAAEVEQLAQTGPVKISAIDGRPVSSWDEILAAAKSKKPGDSVTISFTPASPASKSSATEPKATDVKFTIDPELATALASQMHYMLNVPVDMKTQTQVAANAWDATMMGMEHTKKFVEQVYMTLAGLVRRTVSPDNLHGIVGIAKVGYEVQDRGPVWLWYVLALVSVNLAVANFLPLPIVDGGLFLLLIVEKIRGRPLSLKIQSAIQMVGIVLLAGLFLYVTYNDIFNMTMKK